MSTPVFPEITESPVGLQARVAGLLYLFILVSGTFVYVFVRGGLTSPGNAAATATNILEHELYFRLGFVIEIFTSLSNLPLLVIFYNLFKPVSRILSLLVAFILFAMAIIECINLLNHFAPLILLKDESYLSAFKPEQLQALVYMYLELCKVGIGLTIVFGGCYCLIMGYLIFKSTFLPNILGVLMTISGLCYLTNVALFLVPEHAAFLFPYILMPGGAGELSLSLWLLLMGVNIPKWEKQAGAVSVK